MPEANLALEELEVAVAALLARDPNPTPESIRKLISNFRVMPQFSVSDADAEQLAKTFEMRHGVSMTLAAVLQKKNYEPWIDQAKTILTPHYWSRYQKFLASKRFSSQVLATFDQVTDRIVGLLENPKSLGPWKRRGMVVGHVQSGKTANYTGVICKAADAGYGLIIVIAGIHNNLRNQTQERIDEGFIGMDSAHLLARKSEDKIVGVGRFDLTERPVTFTNSLKDFSKTMATGVGVPLKTLKVPAVLVIKKNSSTLKNLIEWLHEHNAGRNNQAVDVPLLIIDDEADNASINISHGKNEVSRINGQIRTLLHMFDRSCYVGYTATPFANIFIDPDTSDAMFKEDLFPEDFIVGLNPPDNYFGPTRVFIDEPRSFVRHITDNGDSLPLVHPKGFSVTSLPSSLVHALRSFVLARAVRLLRGHMTDHNSMLVNVSRFTDVQGQVRNEIHARLEIIQASARVNGALSPAEALKDPEIAALKKVFEAEYPECGFTWGDVQSQLNESAAPIKTVLINSASADSLKYKEHEKTGLNVIAVGGFSLSRGLTLEGLTVSYFLRNSIMYDTLMQMGRWFGYRPDYDDLCRVWMLDDAEGWYRHVAESTEELRGELRKMEAAGATPMEFGLKVRSHPTTLIVTARNKMGSGTNVVVQIGLSNRFVETTLLKGDGTTLDDNRAVAKGLANRLANAGKPLSNAEPVAGGLLVTDVSVSEVLPFLTEFKNHPGSIMTDPDLVRSYIERRAEELSRWDVLFAGLQETAKGSEPNDLLGVLINCQTRSLGSKSTLRDLRITDNNRVSSRGVEAAGLTAAQRSEAESEYLASPEGAKKGKNFPDWIYRSKRVRSLLIVHLLEVRNANPEINGGKPIVPPDQQPIVAYSISIPDSRVKEVLLEYVVNTTWLKENYPDDVDEEELVSENE